MGDDPAEPVVGVDDVGSFVLVDPVEHTGGERVDDVGKRLLRQVVRTGLDVHDAMARLDEDLAGSPGRSARVYVVQSTPAWASADTSSRTYTFMPPLSPEPGCSSGDVWSEMTATRCTAP